MTKDLPAGSLCSQAVSMLKVDEGVESKPYKDSLGFWTIGVGHLLGKDIYKMQLSDRIITELLIEDMDIAWQAVLNLFGKEIVSSWAAGRQLALLNLSFNLGAVKLGQFQRTIAAIKANDWESAAKHLEASLWAKQVKSRAPRVIYMVRTGQLHEAYSS